MNRARFALAVAAALFGTGVARAADFSFGFDGCPQRLRGNPGDTVIFDAFVTLTSANNPGPDGAQGWSLSVEVTGGTMQKVSVKGVTVNTIYCEDADQDPDTPCDLHPSFDFDLGGAFTNIASKATFKDDATRLGAISAVVMKSQEKMVLQPEGKATILKLSLAGTIPADGCTTLTLHFVDGFKSSVSQPVSNVVTFGGASVKPTLGTCSVQLCAAEPEFHLAMVEPGRLAPGSGDYELVAQVLAGDVIVPVDVILRSVNLPPAGDGPQGWTLSIANDSCMTVDSVTLKGVTVSAIYCQDDDQDPDTPCILHDPFIFDLDGAVTHIAARATGTPPSPVNDPDQAGVISAVTLNTLENMVLHPNATDTILRINYKITVEAGKTTNCRGFFLNGLKSSVSPPMNNVITLEGVSKRPEVLQGIVIRLTGTALLPEAPFKSGDANNDGKFNLADAVRVVMAVVPSMGPPLDCADAGDADENGRLELPDAIYIIDWQFRNGPPPRPPFPACGLREGATSCPVSYICTQ